MLELKKMLTEEYRELLAQCSHCGLCLETCPTYAIFGTEMDAPRGRIALMRAAVDGKIGHQDFLDTFGEHITLCLECRACETACPSGVQYGKLIEGARIDLEDLRKPGLAERFVKWVGMEQLMPHVGQMKLLARVMWVYQALGLQSLVRTVNLLPQPLHAMEGILPPLSAGYQKYDQPALPLGEKRGTVAFFYGCIQEAFLAAVNASTIRVLQRNGYEVHFPQSQTCCGAAQWHTGAEDLAMQLAKQNIDTFEDYDVVINNAGGCGLTLKEYPDLLKEDVVYASKSVEFAAKVQDFSEFMFDHLHVAPQGALNVRATYSDSCHLRHGQGVINQPRELLKKIPGLELIELPHPDRCCGSAGIYNIVQYDTANAVLAAKMEDIAATGVDVVVTSNTGCHMQLVSGVRKAELNTKVLHIAEMLDLSYRADDRRLRAQVRHPSPIFRGPSEPDRWLAWQDRRMRRRKDTPLMSLKRELEPGQVLDDPVELLTYEADGGVDRGTPVGVVFPYSPEDVQTVMRWSKDQKVPVIVRGAGTGLAGGSVPLQHGLLLGVSHLKKLLDMDVIGRSAVVEPGIVNLTLDTIARGEGLYFPPDPASGRAATVGGNIGANAGGPHCFKYGVTSNYITGLKAVLADGRLFKFGGRALDYPELDFVGLFTGSEGTLGILTEASVRLVGDPPAVRTMLAAFESVAQAGEAVSAIIAAGLVPATLEMMGQRIMRIIEDYNHPGLPVDSGAVIIIDVDGYPESMQSQLDEVQGVLQANGAEEVRVAQSEEERTNIWKARKSAAGALARVALDHYTVDGTVPRSLLADTLRETITICEDLDLPVVFLLHAGDGNLHPMVLVSDREDEEFLQRLHEGGKRMSEVFLAKGGTITGEHGVGFEKREFMSMMYSVDELDAMREIKHIFDPEGRLNPDKVFPSLSIKEESESPGDDDARVTASFPMGSDIKPVWVSPKSAEEAAEILRSCAQNGNQVHITGAKQGSDEGHNADVVLSTSALSGILNYSLDDLTITVGAGTLVRDVQSQLSDDGMWVPMQSPWDYATIGGLVSSGLNAPLRMRYGGLRDIVQAMTVVLADGRILRYGRPVMKNVAGYDMIKLFIGAYGSLGLITDVSFKLSPAPRTRHTLVVPMSDMETGMRVGQHLFRKSLIASSVLLCQNVNLPPFVEDNALIYTVEGLVEDVNAEIRQAGEILPAENIEQSEKCDPSGSDIWAEWIRSLVPAGQQSGMLLKIGLPPKDLPALMHNGLEDVIMNSPSMIDFANGHIYSYGVFDLAKIREITAQYEGYAVLLQSFPGQDRWGYAPETLSLMKEIKRGWDPKGILNQGEFVL